MADSPAFPQGPMNKADHLALLKRAIVANLEAREEHDLRQAKAAEGKPVDLMVMSAADLLGADDDRLYLDDLIADPVREALRQQLKDIGWRLFRLLGSTNEMAEIAEEVAGPDNTARWSYRINVIDKCWDNIGEGNDWWVA